MRNNSFVISKFDAAGFNERVQFHELVTIEEIYVSVQAAANAQFSFDTPSTYNPSPTWINSQINAIFPSNNIFRIRVNKQCKSINLVTSAAGRITIFYSKGGK